MAPAVLETDEGERIGLFECRSTGLAYIKRDGALIRSRTKANQLILTETAYGLYAPNYAETFLSWNHEENTYIRD